MEKDTDLDSLAERLQNTRIPTESGVSVAGKGMKLDTAESAKEVITLMNECSKMEILELEGNSIGVEAAGEIGKALEKHPELKKAIWKDMFTGRLKDEIPKALSVLGSGLIKGGVHLTVLDVSDNAMGPIGVAGLEQLLTSSVCFTLQELRLSNLGLGVSGAKILAKALHKCLEDSVAAGKPLQLKVFVAGRNRLENEGAVALARVFKEIGTLETISIPQNGIYLKGIEELSRAFGQNPNLSTINLNDNTLTEDGALALSRVIPQLERLKSLDLGDCLVKSRGASALASALAQANLPFLEEVNLSSNEVDAKAGLEVLHALLPKPKLKSLNLNENRLGLNGIAAIKQAAASKQPLLSSFSDDEGNLDDEELEEEEDDDDEYGEEEIDEEEEEEEDVSDEESIGDEGRESHVVGLSPLLRKQQVGSAAEFLREPTAERLLNIEGDRAEAIISEIKVGRRGTLEEMLQAIMAVSGLVASGRTGEERSLALTTSERLYQALFSSAPLSHINNMLPIYLGLIKNEDKCNMKEKYNQDGCLKAVENAIKKELIPKETRAMIEIFTSSRK